MAQKVEVRLIDDLDGKEANETISFGLDGSNYEIDLSAKNADKLRGAFATYVGVARKAGRIPAKAGRRRSGGSATADREQNQAIREWAKKQGLNVSERGRIPAEIVEKYHASV